MGPTVLGIVHYNGDLEAEQCCSTHYVVQKQSQSFTAVKRHNDHCNSYEGKYLIVAGLHD